jgi:phosphoesterase RecJ-like protein
MNQVRPSESEIAAARQRIANARWIGVISHERPDGDAVGSLLALSLALARAGKQVAPVLGDGLPGRYRFLPGSAEVLRQFPPGIDLLISVDCSDRDRLGIAPERLPRTPDINIDHHPTNTRFATVNLVDDQAPATAGLLVALLPELGLEIDSPVASNLLAGIVTDTIGFRVPGVTSGLLRQAGDLMDLGAPLAEIYEQTLNRHSLAAARFWGLGLERLEREERLLYTTLTLEDRARAGYPGSDDADLINLLMTIDGADITLVFVEQPEGKLKVSWRARAGLDVSRVAASFGGGGHELAAGAMLIGPTPEVIERVLAATRAALRPADRGQG